MAPEPRIAAKCREMVKEKRQQALILPNGTKHFRGIELLYLVLPELGSAWLSHAS